MTDAAADRQSAHYEGCWRSHLNCATREVARLREELRAANREIGRLREEAARLRRVLRVETTSRIVTE